MSETTTILQRARFAWDSTEDDAEAIFTGYHLPSRRWNGWATPMFERAEADRIMAWQAAHADPDVDERITFDAEQDRYYLDSPGEHGSREEVPGSDLGTADGFKHLYAIGAFAWTWDEVPPAAPRCWCGGAVQASHKVYLTLAADGSWINESDDIGGGLDLYCSEDHVIAEDVDTLYGLPDEETVRALVDEANRSHAEAQS